MGLRRWLRRRMTRSTPTTGVVNGMAAALRDSGLVDEAWYRATYPDVAAAGIPPVEHYALSGAQEGRNPNPFFDTKFYLKSNPDVQQAGLNPLLHYIVTGAQEGRAAGSGFDTAYYLEQYPDIKMSGMNPLLHYLRFGRHEGRRAALAAVKRRRE